MNFVDYLYLSRKPDVIIEHTPHDYTFIKNGKTHARCQRLIKVEENFGRNAWVFCTTYIDGDTTIWEAYLQKNENVYAIEAFVSNAFRQIIFYFYLFEGKEFNETDATLFTKEKELLVSLIVEHPAHRLFFATGDVKIEY